MILSHVGSPFGLGICFYLLGYLFPLPFDIAAFACWESLTPTGGLVRLTAFLLQLQYLNAAFADPIGVFTFRKFEMRLGWVLTIFRGQGVCTLIYGFSFLICPVPFGKSVSALFHSSVNNGTLCSKFTCVHPSNLPLARNHF